MSIPLVQNNEKDSINISIIAIKKNLERINSILGLVDSGSDIDTSEFVKKSDIVDVVQSGNMNPVTSNAVVPVDTVTSGDMHSVTSNAVYSAISALKTVSRWHFSSGSQSAGVLPVVNDGYNDNPNIYLDGNKFKFRGTARYLVIVHIIGQIEGSDRLFFKVEGLNLDVFGINYGAYAECDIVFPAEVNENIEIYVNMLESFRVNGGGIANSYIAFSPI